MRFQTAPRPEIDRVSYYITPFLCQEIKWRGIKPLVSFTKHGSDSAPNAHKDLMSKCKFFQIPDSFSKERVPTLGWLFVVL